MKQYGIELQQIVNAVRQSNRDIGAQTLEINKAEYLVRGLGYIKSLEDIENAVVSSEAYTSLRIGDLAKSPWALRSDGVYWIRKVPKWSGEW